MGERGGRVRGAGALGARVVVVRGRWLRCRSWALVVRQPLLVVFVVARRSVSFVGCWMSFAACCLLCVWVSIGRLSYFGQPCLFVVGVA